MTRRKRYDGFADSLAVGIVELAITLGIQDQREAVQKLTRAANLIGLDTLRVYVAHAEQHPLGERYRAFQALIANRLPPRKGKPKKRSPLAPITGEEVNPEIDKLMREKPRR